MKFRNDIGPYLLQAMVGSGLEGCVFSDLGVIVRPGTEAGGRFTSARTESACDSIPGDCGGK